LISGEVGEAKPGPEIFEIAMDSLGSSKDGTFYVGNAPGHDVLGAKNAGIVSVLVNRDGDPSGPEPDHEVKDLRELWDIIDEMEGRK